MQTRTLDYATFALSVARSMVGAKLPESAHSRLFMIVLWPDVWSGVQRQLKHDLPREKLFWNKAHIDSRTVVDRLYNAHGALWSRWACLYLNQASMADVFTHVQRDAHMRLGPHAMVCETRPANALRINVESDNREGLALVFRKDFRVLDVADDCVLATVRTHFRITLRPYLLARLRWNFITQSGRPVCASRQVPRCVGETETAPG